MGFQVHDKQKEIAKKVLEKIQQKFQNLKQFKYFDFHIIVPKYKSLGKQTIERLKEFIEYEQSISEDFLQDIQDDISASRVEDHVIRI